MEPKPIKVIKTNDNMKSKPVITIETRNGTLQIMEPLKPPTKEDYDRYYKALAKALIKKKSKKEK